MVAICGLANRAALAAGSCPAAPRGARVVMHARQGIHPEWHDAAPVFCNGVEVMTVGGTKAEYNVDVYSGNHPFYLGKNTILVSDAGQLDKFKKRFGGLEELTQLGAAAGMSSAPTEDPSMKKIGGQPKAKGKKRR